MNEPICPQNTPSVLMVDDTPANLELLTGMLKGRGYKVRAAVSGELALQAARNDPPDLILLDISMPGMDGYEVCVKLKSDERLKDIPVIFLSALNETMDKVKAFGNGGVDYITKPFQFEEVEARVETHLKLRRQKQLLQENYNELSELKKMRDSLVDMIIRDLRQPLASIRDNLELMAAKSKDSPSADCARCLAEALKSAKQIAHMVSDILDTNKLKEGKMALKLAECDLTAMLEEVIRELKPVLESREIRLTPPAGPVIVLADRGIISRAIQNMLANAIKFTPKDNGLIRLDIQASGDRIRLSVKDNGPGIAPALREKIFGKFGPVELRAGHQLNSASLGLAFCKMAVEAHGGEIGVDSEEGKGSSFWFELPANGPGQDGAAARPRAESY